MEKFPLQKLSVEKISCSNDFFPRQQIITRFSDPE
jgi:hypothetical protein